MKLGVTERFQRVPEAVPAGRVFVRRWLLARRRSDAVDRLVLAATEAMNNVIEHADGNEFWVTVACDGARASVVVTDAGDGFRASTGPAMPPPSATSGRGLALIHALVDDVQVTSTPAGTTVALTHDLTPATEPVPA